MMRLRDRCLLTLWPRQLALWQQGALPQSLPRNLVGPLADWLAGGAGDGLDLSGSLAGSVEPGDVAAGDAWMEQRLRELDAEYANWPLDGATSDAAALAQITASQARLRLVPMDDGGPVLPSSVLRRVQIIRAHEPRTILLFGDGDGASLWLAEKSEVHLLTRERLTRLHLEREARRRGVVERLRFLDVAPEVPSYDAAWLPFAAIDRATAALARSARVVKPGGHVFVSLRAPWDEVFFERLDGQAFKVASYFREIEHPYVPGGYGLDGAADVVVLERLPGDHHLATIESPSDVMRVMPHHSFDVDALAVGSLGVDALDRLATLVGALSPRPAAVTDFSRDAQREILWWYDADGLGFVADLRREAAHLRVDFMPYDAALEQAVKCAIFWSLGDTDTRLRPQRTHRTPDAVILP